MNKTVLRLITAATVASVAVVPTMASAADYRGYVSHRQQQQNTWKTATVGAATVGIYGLIKGDKNLALLGAAGALYSGYRYDQDRKNDWRRNDRYGYYGRYDRYPTSNRYDRSDDRHYRSGDWKRHDRGHAFDRNRR